MQESRIRRVSDASHSYTADVDWLLDSDGVMNKLAALVRAEHCFRGVDPADAFLCDTVSWSFWGIGIDGADAIACCAWRACCKFCVPTDHWRVRDCDSKMTWVACGLSLPLSIAIKTSVEDFILIMLKILRLQGSLVAHWAEDVVGTSLWVLRHIWVSSYLNFLSGAIYQWLFYLRDGTTIDSCGFFICCVGARRLLVIWLEWSIQILITLLFCCAVPLVVKLFEKLTRFCLSQLFDFIVIQAA